MATAGPFLAEQSGNMKIAIESLGKWLPVPVLILDRMPGRLIGLSLGVFIVLRSDHAADRPTIAHELEHCKQFWKGGLVFHMARYYLSRSYRLQAEVEAFQAELRACPPQVRPQRLQESARVLSGCYDVGVCETDCLHLLIGEPQAEWSLAHGLSEGHLNPSPMPVAARSTDSTHA